MRLIDADELKKDFNLNFGGISHAAAATEIIDRQPTIDPESLRPHGKWVKDQFSYRYLCTNCKMTLPEWMGVFNYCPCCGAKMEDKSDD